MGYSILQTLGMDVLAGTGSPIRTMEISRNLFEKGHDVYVSSFMSRDQDEVTDREGLAVRRTPFPRVPSEEMRTLLGKRRLTSLNMRLIRKAGIEIIHSHLFLAAGSSMNLSRELGVPFIYDMHSLFPEERIASGGILWKLRLLPWKPVEERIRSRCSHIIATSDTMRDFLLERGYPRVESVPVGVNTEFFRPQRPDQGIIREYGLEGKKVIMYTGNMNPYQGMDDIVRAAALVREESRDIIFMIVGGGGGLDGYRRMASGLGADNIIFTGPQPYSRMPGILSVADVCLSMRTSDFSGNVTFPTKLTTYMAAGKPSICTRVGDQKRMLEKNGIGRLVESGNPQEAARAAIEMASDEKALEKQGNMARKVALGEYSWDVLTEKYERIYDRILG